MAGPITGGVINKPTPGPQSGVFTSSIGGQEGMMAVPLQLIHLPLAGDSIIRVRCDGILSLRGRAVGSDPLRELLGAKCYGHRVLMSLEKIIGAETSGVSWLYQCGERFQQAGGKLTLFAVPANVLTLLEMLELDLTFKMASTESDAMEALKDTPSQA